MTAFFIASLSMIGIPPVGGFISKWYLIVGAIEAQQLAFVLVLLISSLLNAAYFLPISYTAFFDKEAPPSGAAPAAPIREIPLMAATVMTTALLSLLLGLYPDYFLSLAQEAIK
jgi:multicomponent Na+:H+ antiporter subunit D